MFIQGGDQMEQVLWLVGAVAAVGILLIFEELREIKNILRKKQV